MEQFSLEKYLETPSRKVVTRDGRPVRIVCWNLKCNTPIIAAIQWNQEREDCYCYNAKGWCANNEGELDLFFADEEELTEFEKEVKDLMNSCCNEIKEADITNELAKEAASNLLDLARKQLQPEFDKEMDKMLAETDKVVYQKGQQDALKELPKWKRSNYFFNTGNKFELGKTLLRRFDGYEIPYSELEKLPKEEL